MAQDSKHMAQAFASLLHVAHSFKKLGAGRDGMSRHSRAEGEGMVVYSTNWLFMLG